MLHKSDIGNNRHSRAGGNPDKSRTRRLRSIGASPTDKSEANKILTKAKTVGRVPALALANKKPDMSATTVNVGFLRPTSGTSEPDLRFSKKHVSHAPDGSTEEQKRIEPDTVYILAGGASRRMGADKLFIDIDGEALLAHTIRICKSVFAHVTIVAKECEKFSALGVPVIIDSPIAPGPLGGLIAAIEDCRGDSCFVIAADLADIDVTIIHALLKQYNGEDYLGLSESGRIQPLCGVYAKATLSRLRSVAENTDNYHLWRIVQDMRSSFIPAPKSHWRNINTPADIFKEGRP